MQPLERGDQKEHLESDLTALGLLTAIAQVFLIARFLGTDAKVESHHDFGGTR